MKLKDLCEIAPENVTKGIILGESNVTNTVFHDMSDLSLRFKLDEVLGFDIRDHEGERTLFVHLAHWGIGK